MPRRMTARLWSLWPSATPSELQSCPTQWCKVASGDIRGWVARTAIWGLLDGGV